MKNTNTGKRAVLVGELLRRAKNEAELYPTLGQLYAQGYTHAQDCGEDYYLATESLEGLEASVETLQAEGFTVYDLQEDGGLEAL